LDFYAVGQCSNDRDTEAGPVRSGGPGYPEAEIGYLDHKPLGTVDLGSHRNRPIVPASERMDDRVGDRFRDRELDVVAVRPSRLGVLRHPFASFGDAPGVTAGPQLERRQIAA
jgi:hypothetical protein